MKFELTSSAFQDSAAIPRRFTCDGEDVSPALAWKGAPAGTAAFALIMEDPDAPAGVWIHWVLYDIPGTASSLAEGLPAGETLSDGSKQGASWGTATFERIGYGGPCPPPGKPHRYFFRLYALSARTGLPAGATKERLMKAIEGRTLGGCEFVGLYGR